MRYTLSTQANGPAGSLLTLALVREDGHSLYLIVPEPPRPLETWVAEKVWPVRLLVRLGVLPVPVAVHSWAYRISLFLHEDPDKNPVLTAGCPGDIAQLCCLLRGSWDRLSILPMQLDFHLVQVRTWPNSLPGATRHNAWWEAYALGRRLDFRGLTKLIPPFEPELKASRKALTSAARRPDLQTAVSEKHRQPSVATTGTGARPAPPD